MAGIPGAARHHVLGAGKGAKPAEAEKMAKGPDKKGGLITRNIPSTTVTSTRTSQQSIINHTPQ